MNQRLDFKLYVEIENESVLKQKLRNFPWSEQLVKSKIAVLCTKDDQVIGACGIRFFFNYLTLFVRRSYRRQGVGNLLMRKLLEAVSKRGVSFLTLITNTDNREAEHLFHAFGFRVIAVYQGNNDHEYSIEFFADSVRKIPFYVLRVLLFPFPKCAMLTIVKIVSKTEKRSLG